MHDRRPSARCASAEGRCARSRPTKIGWAREPEPTRRGPIGEDDAGARAQEEWWRRMRPTISERCSRCRHGSWRMSARCAPCATGRGRTPAFAAAYRKQAAELGWFSMLVPEALGGGSVSDDGALDAALIAYRRGATLQPGLVRRHQRRRLRARPGRQRDGADLGAAGAVERRGRRRRGPWTRPAPGSTAVSRPGSSTTAGWSSPGRSGPCRTSSRPPGCSSPRRRPTVRRRR